MFQKNWEVRLGIFVQITLTQNNIVVYYCYNLLMGNNEDICKKKIPTKTIICKIKLQSQN